MNNHSFSIKAQSGVTLIISLVILLLLTLIGISGMRTTSLEEKMASNMRDRNLAFQAAEAALRHGEQYVEAGNAATSVTSLNTSSAALAIPGASVITGLSSQPTYTVTLINIETSSLANYVTYRITSTAAGASSTTQVQLESIFIAQIDDSLITL